MNESKFFCWRILTKVSNNKNLEKKLLSWNKPKRCDDHWLAHLFIFALKELTKILPPAGLLLQKVQWKRLYCGFLDVELYFHAQRNRRSSQRATNSSANTTAERNVYIALCRNRSSSPLTIGSGHVMWRTGDWQVLPTLWVGARGSYRRRVIRLRWWWYRLRISVYVMIDDLRHDLCS